MRVLRPRTLDEALAMKAEHPDAVPVAGGTDLWVHWPTNLDGHERLYLDLAGLAALRHLTWTDEDFVIGATATYWDTLGDERCRAELPILLEAARQVGAIQIQTRGTWAGNIANASPAADGVASLMACDAEVVLTSVRGERSVGLDAYYHDYKVTAADPDELISAIRVPRRPYSFGRFEKVGSRRAQTITKTGIAMTVSDAGWRVVANSMAPTVRRCRRLEAVLASEPGGTTPATVAPALDADLSPIDDLRSTAAYRRRVCARLVAALVEEQRERD